MKNPFKIPFPRQTIKQYFYIAIVMGLVVNFILIFFQPFGTQSFIHPRKNLILAGYGLTICLTTIIFYTLSIYVIHRNKEDSWNILYEVLDLFFVVFICLLTSYLYSTEVFDGTYRWSHMLSFVKTTSPVAFFPALICLAYLYTKWQDVTRSTVEEISNNTSSGEVELTLGYNKNDQIKASANEIIVAKSQDNYVMLYLMKEQKIQRHILRSTLKKIKEQLNSKTFVQIHRSYIVNGNKILKIHGNKSKATVEIINFDKKIPLSRSYYDAIKNIASN